MALLRSFHSKPLVLNSFGLSHSFHVSLQCGKKINSSFEKNVFELSTRGTCFQRFSTASPVSWLKTKSAPKAKVFVPFKSRGVVCLVGRPNVGKSTLFNKLVGKSLAIVDNTPGTTRDRRLAQGTISGCEFLVIDTPGLDEHDGNCGNELNLQKSMTEQTLAAIKESDIVLFVVDGREGLTPVDEHFAKWLRKHCDASKIHVIANKTENIDSDDEHFADLYKLGFDDLIKMSAYHALGMGDLFQLLNSKLPQLAPEDKNLSNKGEIKSVKKEKLETVVDETNLAETKEVALPLYDESVVMDDELKKMVEEANKQPVDSSMTDKPPIIQFAIIGRPNVGKSTLINSLLGFDRVVTSPVPHTTRDSIAVDHDFKGRTIRFVDTAGLQGTSSFLRKQLNRLEGLMMDDAINSLKRANICAVVVDIEPDVASSELLEMIKTVKEKKLFSKQAERPDYLHRLATKIFPHTDITIASKVIEEGRALVLLINKFDLIDKSLHKSVIDGLELVVKHVLPSAKGVPILPISALHKFKLATILPNVVKQFDRWNTKIATNKLNSWMRQITRLHPPPRVSGRQLKIRFMNQTHTRPPHFSLFFNSSSNEISETYVRYLTNALREEFDMDGVPIRVTVKQARNPFNSDKVPSKKRIL